MDRDNMGKALHSYLSRSQLIFAMRNGATQKRWEDLTEEIQEEYRKVGKGLAQDFIYGGDYELSLAPLEEVQILYNGLLSYLSPTGHHRNGWCHLLLIRSRNRDTDNEELVQKMAIVTQTPGSLLAIQREIEYIATFLMDFFSFSLFNHPHDDVTITPENTRFIEYIPYCTLRDTTDTTDETHKNDPVFGTNISIVRFQWEEEKDTARTFRNYKASNPSWQDTSVSAVNALIQHL